MIDTPQFGPVFHKKGQLKQSLVYLGVILEKLCVSNSKEIVDAYVTREATSWIGHLYNRNSGTGNCLHKLHVRDQEEKHEHTIMRRHGRPRGKT